MTEEIIIDGVDVAGCKYYIQDYQRANNIEGRYEHCKNVCELNGDNYFYCKMNNDCYYKQLKRLEQENIELKNQIESQKGLITVGGKQQYQYLQRIDCLEQENRELKEKIKKYSAINEQDTKDYVELKRENIRLFNESIELRAKNIEYKHALEEIRKLTVIGVNASQCNCGLRALADDILNKINEVLNESK